MRTKDSTMSAGLTQSVVRALSILTCFTDETPELRMTDISQRLELTPSLVSRLLGTLEHDGFVEQDPSTGMYRLGRSILTLAGVTLNHNQLRMEALGEMHVASRRINLGVNLSMLDGDTILYLAHLETPDNPRPYTLIGRRNPLHATAMGKLLLAYLPDDVRLKTVNRIRLTPYTVKTLKTRDTLLLQLDEIREQGWAVENEELALGRLCIAGGVRDKTGRVIGSISFSGPLSQIKWEKRKPELIEQIIELCDRVSMRMGYITAAGMM
jgi:DNA-binding IclR family transcriptional regulator